jgi:hypothetical protein
MKGRKGKKASLTALALVAMVPVAHGASDLIGDAASISLPYQEVVDNSSFTTIDPPTLACDSNSDFNGDFFYRYTPSVDETINIKAIGDDTEIKVFDLADVGSECLVYQDADNIVSPNWWTENYPELLADSSCDGDCAEDLDIALSAGIEYTIAIGVNDSDALGLICLNIASGAGAAADTCPAGPATPVPTLPFSLLLALGSLAGLLGMRRLRG